MLRHLCDRCGLDTTGKKSAAVSIVGDADIHGNGTVTRGADLCIACRDALDAWLTPSATLQAVDAPVGRVLVDKRDLRKRKTKGGTNGTTQRRLHRRARRAGRR